MCGNHSVIRRKITLLRLIALAVPILFLSACIETFPDSGVTIQSQNEKSLQTRIKIRKRIISSIIFDYLSAFSPQEKIAIRLLKGEAFEISDLSDDLREKVKIEFGICRIPIRAGDNDMKDLHEDILDYSPAYIYKYNVICLQIEDFNIPEKSDFLCVNVGIFRSALDACGYTYIFRKTNSGWLFQKRMRTWQS